MRKRVNILVVVALMLVCAGLVLPLLTRLRQSSLRAECARNLRQIGIALHSYSNDWEHFPEAAFPYIGTSDAPSLPYDRRLSWLAAILPYVG